MFKRTLFAVVAALCLVFALAACGDNTATTGTTASTTAPTLATTAPSGGSATTAPSGGKATTAPSGGSLGGSATTAPSGGSATTAPSSGGNATTAPGGTMDAGAMGTMMSGTMPSGTMMPGSPVASGTLDADVPQYTGATAVNLPPQAAASLGQTAGNMKDVKVAIFKTSDKYDKVKAFYNDALTKAGYTNANAVLDTARAGSSSAGTPLMGSAAGMDITTFSKGGKVIAITSLPTDMLSSVGLSGITASDTVFLITSGEQG